MGPLLSETEPSRILVIRSGAIGDFIVTLPAIGALRAHWPQAHIEILGHTSILELAFQRHYADSIQSIDAKSLASLFNPNGNLDRSISRYFANFDLIISYLHDPENVFKNNLYRAGIKNLVNYSPKPTDTHVVEHLCKPIMDLGIHIQDYRPMIFPSTRDTDEILNRFKGLDLGECIVVHPGSGSERKNWPTEKFSALCKWLREDLEATVLIIEGEADQKSVVRLQDSLSPDNYCIVRRTKLTELAALLASCKIFVGNDSGITHLAAAVETPTVAIFGPHSSNLWKPRSPHAKIVAFGHDDLCNVKDTILHLST